MKFDLNQNPQLAATMLINVAPTAELMWFVGHAVRVYFNRLIDWDKPEQLAKFGLRPVVSPLAADEALRRVAYVEFSAAWVHALIANDAEAARLALRAVAYYAKRYSTLHLEQVSAEVGELAMQAVECARLIAMTLDLAPFEL